MNIQIRQIKGDIVELLFNPREEDLRVGENLSLRENGGDRGSTRSPRASRRERARIRKS